MPFRIHKRRNPSASGLFVACVFVLAACGGDPPGPLVGTWEDLSIPADDATGMTMAYTFEADGVLNIDWRRPLQPDTTISADYRVQWDSVLTLSDGRGSEQFIAHVLGDTLRLRSEDGIVRQYARRR